MFEKPTTSIAAKCIAMFSVFCIIVSTIILTLDTLPYFQVSPSLAKKIFKVVHFRKLRLSGRATDPL